MKFISFTKDLKFGKLKLHYVSSNKYQSPEPHKYGRKWMCTWVWKMSNTHGIKMHNVKTQLSKLSIEVYKRWDIQSLCVCCGNIWSIVLWSQTKCMPIIEDNIYPIIDYKGTMKECYTLKKIAQMEILKKIDFHLGKNPNIISNDWRNWRKLMNMIELKAWEDEGGRARKHYKEIDFHLEKTLTS